jgi:hypothetical protein
MSDAAQQTADEQITDWEIRDHTNDRNIPVESRSAGEDKLAEWDGDLDLELFGPDGDPVLSNFAKSQAPHYDSGEVEQVDAEIVEHPADTDPDTDGTTETVMPDVAGGMNIQRDPLNVLPSWMITDVTYQDRGDSSTTINKRGCKVIAEYLGLEETDNEPIKTAGETDFEYATYRVEMTKPDGRSFTGHGTARADESDQGEDAGWKLDMMAETRAYKRAVKSATGGGIEAFAKERGHNG